MTKLEKLHLLGAIKLALLSWRTYRDLLALSFLLVTMLCAIQVASIVKQDEQLKADYNDCFQPLTIEVEKNDR